MSGVLQHWIDNLKSKTMDKYLRIPVRCVTTLDFSLTSKTFDNTCPVILQHLIDTY